MSIGTSGDTKRFRSPCGARTSVRQLADPRSAHVGRVSRTAWPSTSAAFAKLEGDKLSSSPLKKSTVGGNPKFPPIVGAHGREPVLGVAPAAVRRGGLRFLRRGPACAEHADRRRSHTSSTASRGVPSTRGEGQPVAAARLWLASTGPPETAHPGLLVLAGVAAISDAPVFPRVRITPSLAA